MTWRQRAAPIIADTIARVGRDDPKALRKALRDAYPFGERANYPYKAWLDEVRAQLDQGGAQTDNGGAQADMAVEDAAQMDLFER
ncbi:MAG: hypothetical protein RJQ08_11690 [Salinisphaeraceae bacterium]